MCIFSSLAEFYHNHRVTWLSPFLHHFLFALGITPQILIAQTQYLNLFKLQLYSLQVFADDVDFPVGGSKVQIFKLSIEPLVIPHKNGNSLKKTLLSLKAKTYSIGMGKQRGFLVKTINMVKRILKSNNQGLYVTSVVFITIINIFQSSRNFHFCAFHNICFLSQYYSQKTNYNEDDGF